jgi:hypothetical protein
MKKHRRKLQCLVQRCEFAFYRTDKLQLHLKQSHSTTDRALCPSCGDGPYTLDLLGVHIQTRYLGHSSVLTLELERLMVHQRRCPIPSCAEWTSPSNVQDHIRTHDTIERQKSEECLRERCYDINANIICPCCGMEVSTYSEFQDHVENHLVTDIAHLQACRLAAQTYCGTGSTKWSWSSWFLDRAVPFHSTLLCTFCGFESTVEQDRRFDHHLDLRQDPGTLRPFRIQLLGLLSSWFALHPVFDDLRPKTGSDCKRPKYHATTMYAHV